MQHWKELIHQENLSEEELRQIPSRCCVNQSAAVQEFNQFGLDSELLVQNTGLSIEQVTDPNRWINPLQTMQFDHNFFMHRPTPAVHTRYSENGARTITEASSAIRLAILFVPVKQLLRQVQKENRRFNNEMEIEIIRRRKRNRYILLHNYAYHKTCRLGHECHFVEGVFGGILQAKQFSHAHITEAFCSQILEHVVTRFYARLQLTYEEIGTRVYINKQYAADIRGLDPSEFPNLPLELTEKMPQWKCRVIHNDITINGQTLFRRGEIYNAPSCCFEASWAGRGIGGFFKNFLGLRHIRRSAIIHELQSQLEQAQAKEHEALQLRELALVQKKEADHRSSIFQVYTRRSLASAVDQGQNPLLFTPEMQQHVVMFNDIRDFTTLAEKMTPIDVVRFLNGYFSRVNRVIQANHGEIDKLIGDCVMASFSSRDDGVRAAIACRHQLSDYNRQRYSHGLQPIQTGFGLTYGNVIVGNIGSDSKMDFTIIGDIVNAASRVEALTKFYRVGILVSEEVLRDTSSDRYVRKIDTVLVKGKNNPIDVYEIYDYEPEEIRNIKLGMHKRFEEADHLYRSKQYTAAAQRYKEMIHDCGPHRLHPDLCLDPVLHVLMERCIQQAEKRAAGQSL